MKIRMSTLVDLKFRKKSCFPEKEKARLKKALESVKGLSTYCTTKNALEEKLEVPLSRIGYKRDEKPFKNIKSKFRDGKGFNHQFDFYNEKLKIAIEIEKTKTTSILLDIMKFVIGRKRNLVEYGVLVIPDLYRTKTHPEGHNDKHPNHAKNDLTFISPVLFIKDILIIEYSTDKSGLNSD